MQTEVTGKHDVGLDLELQKDMACRANSKRASCLGEIKKKQVSNQKYNYSRVLVSLHEVGDVE